ncbi:MAG: hypothetical protein HYU66_24705 [Armatimonadetes bacterium]|nr:hypothetical protein [Armatimonadota bacterium]
MSDVRIGAHRGAMCHAPENTLPAFETAVAMGTWRIELDVRRTRDGVLVLLHDDSVDRTTDGTGKLAEMDYDAVRRLRCPGAVPLPTFSETLEFARDRVRLLVEIKDSACVDEVTYSIRCAGLWETCTISCFDEAVLRRVKALEPRIDTAFFHLAQGDLNLRKVREELGCRLLIVWPPGADPAQVAAARAAGMDVRCGLGDNVSFEETAEVVRRMAAMGANEISCGRPDWIARIVAEL